VILRYRGLLIIKRGVRIGFGCFDFVDEFCTMDYGIESLLHWILWSLLALGNVDGVWHFAVSADLCILF
jgi:hypothetical protein